jgi:hypothetical protein
MIPVIYHGSLKSEHGRGELTGSNGSRYMITSCNDHPLINVRRESFTIIDENPANAELEELHLNN